MMRCARCNFEAAPTARYCSACGQCLVTERNEGEQVFVKNPDVTQVALDEEQSLKGEKAAEQLQHEKDITQLRDVEERYRLLFEQCPDAIVIVDPTTTRLLDFNNAALQVYGYSAAELKDLTVPQLEALETPEDVAARSSRVMEMGNDHFETRHRTKTGAVIDVLISVWVVKLDGRRVFYSVVRNISDQKTAERRLKSSEEQLRQLIDNCFGFIGLYDLDGTLVHANRAALEAGGLQCDDVIGKPFADTYWWSHSINVQKQLLANMRRAAEGETVRYETTALMAGGRIIDLDVTFGPMQNSQGKIINIVGFGVDITERKRALAMLRESEARYRSYVDHSPYGVFICDENARYIDVNPASCRITGYEPSELLQLRIPDLLPPEYLSLGLEQFAQLREKDTTFGEFPFLHKNGERRWWSVAGARLSNTRFLGFVTDITDHKLAEQRLRDSEECFRAIFEQAAVGVAEIETTTGQFVRVNRKCCEILAYTPDELLQLDCVGTTHPDDRELHIEFMGRLRSGAMREFTTEKRMVRKDGTTPWVRITVSPTWPPGASPTYHIAVIQDITERKQAEELQQTHSQVLVSMAEAVSFLDGQGTIRFTNRALDSMFGYRPGELIGQSVTVLNDATPEEDQRKVTEVMASMAAHGVWNGEFRNRRKDGTVFWTEAHISQTSISGETCFISVQQDVTVRKVELEQSNVLRDQLAHVARLATMGEMASGLAHELNQPLNALEMYAKAALELDAGHDSAGLQRCLQRISEQSLRAGEIVRNMRTFIGRSTTKRKMKNVNQLIRSLFPILDNDWRQNSIKVKMDLDENLPSVPIHGVQIQQVLVNLIRNAIEAMSQMSGGIRHLSIQTRAVENGVYVSVADTGPGLPPPIAAKLFHPFESTKPEGLGLGIGLAISRTLIEAHGGHIEANPNPGGGTTFSFVLPAGNEEIPA